MVSSGLSLAQYDDLRSASTLSSCTSLRSSLMRYSPFSLLIASLKYNDSMWGCRNKSKRYAGSPPTLTFLPYVTSPVSLQKHHRLDLSSIDILSNPQLIRPYVYPISRQLTLRTYQFQLTRLPKKRYSHPEPSELCQSSWYSTPENTPMKMRVYWWLHFCRQVLRLLRVKHYPCIQRQHTLPLKLGLKSN